MLWMSFWIVCGIMVQSKCILRTISERYFIRCKCENLFYFVKYLCSRINFLNTLLNTRFWNFQQILPSDKQYIMASSKGFHTHLWNSFTTDRCCWKIFLYFLSLENHLRGKRYQRHQGPYGNQRVSLQSPWPSQCPSSSWSVWPQECKLWFIISVRFINRNSPNKAGRRYQTNSTHKWSCRKHEGNVSCVDRGKNLSFPMTGKYFLLY